MVKLELIDELTKHLSSMVSVDSAGKIKGEDAIGVLFDDGQEYFITVEEA